MESMDDQEPENERGSSTTTQLTFGKDTSKNPFTDPMKLSSKVYLESRNNTLSKTLEEYGGVGKERKGRVTEQEVTSSSPTAPGRTFLLNTVLGYSEGMFW